MFNGSKIKQLRKKKKMSLEQVSRSLFSTGVKISFQSISNWEKGTHVPDANNLKAIASLFGKNIEYFFN